jgi:hypothetical protein
MAGCFEHGNESSVSIRDGEFLDWLSVLLDSQEGLCSMELLVRDRNFRSVEIVPFSK